MTMPHGQPDGRHRILVADDDPELCRTLAELLESHGYEVRTVRDGEECLAEMRDWEPELVVLDLRMPRRDGLSVLSEAKLAGCDARAPDIIVLTGRGGVADGVHAIRAGAIGFLTKPARTIELLTLVDRTIANREAARQTSSLLRETEKRWSCAITSRRSNIRSVVSQLATEMQTFAFTSGSRMRRLLMAADEALANAIIHGSLRATECLSAHDDPDALEAVIRERENDPAYANRLVRVTLDLTSDEARLEVRDEGPGFDFRSLPDPDDPGALLMSHGRGILLMRALADDIVFGDSGRSVSLIVRARPGVECVSEQVL